MTCIAQRFDLFFLNQRGFPCNGYDPFISTALSTNFISEWRDQTAYISWLTLSEFSYGEEGEVFFQHLLTHFQGRHLIGPPWIIYSYSSHWLWPRRGFIISQTWSHECHELHRIIALHSKWVLLPEEEAKKYWKTDIRCLSSLWFQNYHAPLLPLQIISH